MEMERRSSLPPASSTWKQPLRGLVEKARGTHSPLHPGTPHVTVPLSQALPRHGSSFHLHCLTCLPGSRHLLPPSGGHTGGMPGPEGSREMVQPWLL